MKAVKNHTLKESFELAKTVLSLNHTPQSLQQYSL